MFDQSGAHRVYQYEAVDETEVVDVEELQPPPSRPRVDTADLTMHVAIPESGEWHRLHPSTVKTACGIPVNYWRSDKRNGRVVEHPLAPCACWTDDERAEADANYRDKFGMDFK